jgi:hypothetical protein
VALLVAAPGAPAAQTQEERAATLDAEARAAFGRGDFAAAAAGFDEADRLAPYTELRYNAALAWERAGERARAADGYESALRRGGLRADLERKARTQLATLKERLGYVRVPAPLGAVVSVAHVQRAPVPLGFHLPAGEHTLSIESADGQTRAVKVALRAGEVTTLDVGGETATPAPFRPVASVAPPPPVAPPPDDGGLSPRVTWGLVALGGAAVFGGAATWLGFATVSASDDYQDSGYTDGDARDRGVRNRALTNVAIGAAVLSAGVGGYLLLSAAAQGKGSVTPAVSVRIDPLGASGRVAF